LEERFARGAVNLDDDHGIEIPEHRRDEIRLIVEASENIPGYRFGVDKSTGRVVTANDSEMVSVDAENATITIRIKEDSKPSTESELRRKVPEGWD
jgi:hypothetical protein